MFRKHVRITLALLAILLAGTALAHQTKTVGNGQFKVMAGFLNGPVYSGQMTGIDLIVLTAEDEPVENLEQSLTALVIAPDDSTLQLVLRAQSDKPGYYTGDFIPTASGNYTFRISGFIGAVEFDETFDTPSHTEPFVLDASTIEIP